MSEVIIVNPKKLERAKRAIQQDGAGSLHILADFDQTLMKAFVDGKMIKSFTGALRRHSLLTPEYGAKATALSEKYFPIEKDVSIPLDERKQKMQEWWSQLFDLLITSGLTRDHILSTIDLSNAQLRDGALEFFTTLNERSIPLVIMSATALGSNAITMFLEKNNVLFPNVHVIANTFIWDETGRVVGVNEPFIHALNKDDTAIQNFPAHGAVKHRKNVILLGDIIDDIGMVKGFDYANLITIGFLNEDVEKRLPAFRDNFDMIILNDGPMDAVNDIIENLVQ